MSVASVPFSLGGGSLVVGSGPCDWWPSTYALVEEALTAHVRGRKPVSLFPKKTIILNEHPDLQEMLKDQETVYEVKYIPIAWLPMEVAQKLDEMQDIRGDVEGGASPTKEQTAEVMAIQLSVIKLMITSWNLVDMQDEPLPLPSVDEKSWGKVPMAVQFAIWKNMTSDGTGVEIPLVNETPSSPPSTPEEATAVEPSPKAEPAVV